MTDEPNTPPQTRRPATFVYQPTSRERELDREVAALHRSLGLIEARVAELHKVVVLELLLLAMGIAAILALAYAVGSR